MNSSIPRTETIPHDQRPSARTCYQRPQITSLSEEQLLDLLGPVETGGYINPWGLPPGVVPPGVLP